MFCCCWKWNKTRRKNVCSCKNRHEIKHDIMTVNNHCDRWLTHRWLWCCVFLLRVFLGNWTVRTPQPRIHAWSRFLRCHGELRACQPLFNVSWCFTHTKNNVAGKKRKESSEIQTWRVYLTFCLCDSSSSSTFHGGFCGAFVPFYAFPCAFNVFMNVAVTLQPCCWSFHYVFNRQNIIRRGIWR